MRLSILAIFPLVCLLPLFGCGQDDGGDDGNKEKTPYTKSFVQVSTKNPAYFQLSNGDTYVPIGCNICWAGDIETLERYLMELGKNGGNYARLWISHGLFEYQTQYGEVNKWGLGNLDRALYAAAKYGIKLKLCIEDCRRIDPAWGNNSNVKISYHVDNGGPFNNIAEYITTPRGKAVYLDRVSFFRDRYGDDPRVFAWEIWNEMNAVQVPEADIIAWNREMIPKVHNLFPKNLVTQSLGSMDRDWCFQFYEAFMGIAGNQIMQVHRYLDEGAPLGVCQAPVDVLASDAVEKLRTYGHRKPILLAETGGVEPNHSGPHRGYANDREGMILHDVLFAPFFSGAAGSGECWHWDEYIDRNDVWWQFRRFVNALQGVDPVIEGFTPARSDQNDLRVYVLKGAGTTLVWCRDVNNTWQTELIDLVPPSVISGKQIDLSGVLGGKTIAGVEAYDPWKDQWTTLSASAKPALPDFKRSLVLKIKHK